MKKIVFILGLAAILFSCNRTTDKKAELDKLKKEHDKISEQISKLEKELSATSQIKADKVSVTEVTPQVFSHYIEVQGRVDGDDNIAVSAKH
jgi:hypothetical protein